MIDAGQVSPAVPESCGARLESQPASRPQLPRQVDGGMSSCRRRDAPGTHRAPCMQQLLVPWPLSRSGQGEGMAGGRGGGESQVTEVINGWVMRGKFAYALGEEKGCSLASSMTNAGKKQEGKNY